MRAEKSKGTSDGAKAGLLISATRETYTLHTAHRPTLCSCVYILGTFAHIFAKLSKLYSYKVPDLPQGVVLV
jgi:hypothetical protein